MVWSCGRRVLNVHAPLNSALSGRAISTPFSKLAPARAVADVGFDGIVGLRCIRRSAGKRKGGQLPLVLGDRGGALGHRRCSSGQARPSGAAWSATTVSI